MGSDCDASLVLAAALSNGFLTFENVNNERTNEKNSTEERGCFSFFSFFFLSLYLSLSCAGCIFTRSTQEKRKRKKKSFFCYIEMKKEKKREETKNIFHFSSPLPVLSRLFVDCRKRKRGKGKSKREKSREKSLRYGKGSRRKGVEDTPSFSSSSHSPRSSSSSSSLS